MEILRFAFSLLLLLASDVFLHCKINENRNWFTLFDAEIEIKFKSMH